MKATYRSEYSLSSSSKIALSCDTMPIVSEGGENGCDSGDGESLLVYVNMYAFREDRVLSRFGEKVGLN